MLDVLVYRWQMFHNEDPCSNSPSTEHIPQILMQPYLGKGHILYTDNYYTSPALADFFINIRKHFGTMKVNQKNYARACWCTVGKRNHCVLQARQWDPYVGLQIQS